MTLRTSGNYDPEFVSTVVEWASLRRAGAVGKYRYSDPLSPDDPVRGMQLYHEFLQQTGDDYYPIKCDLSAFQNAAEKAKTMIPGPVTLIIQGPGTSANEKEFALADEFENVAGCIINDISQDTAQTVRNSAAERFNLTDNQCIAVSYDFFRENIFDRSGIKGNPEFQFIGTPVMIVGGLTISNPEGFPEDGLPKKEVKNILDLWREDLTKAYRLASHSRKTKRTKPHLILSTDTTQDEETILRAYSGQSDFTHNFALRVQRDTPISKRFDPDALDVSYIWHPDSHVLTHNLIPLTKMTFTIGDVEISMNEGQNYIVNNTFKYPIDPFSRMANSAQYHRRRGGTVMDLQERVAAYYLEAQI